MSKITYTNELGESVIFSDRPPFILENIEGLAGVDADIQTQKAPYQDGSTHIDTLLESRVLTLQVAILASSRTDLYERRSLLSGIFNPKLDGTLRYENDYTAKEIPVRVDSGPVYPSPKGNVQECLITLMAPMPFWLDITEQNYKLEDFVTNFRFPFHFPVRFATRGDTRTILNDGDVPTPIEVEFRGHAVNPRIENNTTGEFIQVNREIPADYKLIIDTTFGRKRVSIVAPDGIETNAFHYIDLDSTFFDLEVGENRLSFITDGGNPEVYVYFKKRYVGV